MLLGAEPVAACGVTRVLMVNGSVGRCVLSAREYCRFDLLDAVVIGADGNAKASASGVLSTCLTGAGFARQLGLLAIVVSMAERTTGDEPRADWDYAANLTKKIAHLWQAEGLPPVVLNLSVGSGRWNVKHVPIHGVSSPGSAERSAALETFCRRVSANVGLPAGF